MPKLFLFLLLFVLLSCNRSFDSRWDIEVTAPLFNAQLDLKDLISDSLTSVNADESISLSIMSDALKLNLDTLGSISQVSSIEKFNSPFVSFTLPPGGTFPTPLDETEIAFGDVELKEVHIKSGRIGLDIQSYVEEDLVATFSIVSSTLNGLPFLTEEIIPAGMGDTPGTFYQEYDISGIELDLTGENGNLFNTVVSDLNMIVAPDGNSVTVNSADTIIVEIFYIDIETAYATGFFGSDEINQNNENFSFSMVDGINPGTINFEEVAFDLKVINGIGADFRFRIDELKSINNTFESEILLNHELVGNTINLDRAVDFPVFSSFESLYTLDQSNSNIKEWVENFPDEIAYSLQAEMNPLGNISGGNDFIYCESELGIEISANIPLCFSTQNLLLQDTIDIQIDSETDLENVQSGNLELLIENSFPLEGKIQAFIFDGVSVTDSLITQNIINAFNGVGLNQNNSEKSSLIIPIDQEKYEALKESKKLILKATLNSPDFAPIKIRSGQFIKMTGIFKGEYLIDNA